jgi:hypothetical protein
MMLDGVTAAKGEREVYVALQAQLMFGGECANFWSVVGQQSDANVLDYAWHAYLKIARERSQTRICADGITEADEECLRIIIAARAYIAGATSHKQLMATAEDVRTASTHYDVQMPVDAAASLCAALIAAAPRMCMRDVAWFAIPALAHTTLASDSRAGELREALCDAIVREEPKSYHNTKWTMYDGKMSNLCPSA